MGQDVQKETYEGYQNILGIIATVITVLVGGIALEPYIIPATHHDGGHASDHSSTEESAEHQ